MIALFPGEIALRLPFVPRVMPLLDAPFVWGALAGPVLEPVGFSVPQRAGAATGLSGLLSAVLQGKMAGLDCLVNLEEGNLQAVHPPELQVVSNPHLLIRRDGTGFQIKGRILMPKEQPGAGRVLQP